MSTFLTKEQKLALKEAVELADPSDLHAQQIKKLLNELDAVWELYNMLKDTVKSWDDDEQT